MTREDDGAYTTLEEALAFPILLCDRLRKAVKDSNSYKLECSEIGNRADILSQKLRSLFSLAVAISTPYDRPLRQILIAAANNLDRALSLVRKCKRGRVLRRVVTITSTADFKKILSLLDASLGDLRWLLNLFGSKGAADLTLPPIASTDPVLGWVWSHLAVIQMGSLTDRIEAANSLGGFARGNERYRKTIVEEGGIPPLLKLLKETSTDAQLAATSALLQLATSPDRVRQITIDQAVPLIVRALCNSPSTLQIEFAALVSTMAAQDPVTREEFARENVIKPLISILSSGHELTGEAHPRLKSIHSLVQINKEMGMRWERDNTRQTDKQPGGSPELTLKLKQQCAEALWMLARGSIPNSRRITEAKALQCLSKLMETQDGDLRLNCLNVVMEICAAAELDVEFRRSAFKTNSPAAKDVINQLIRVLQDRRSTENILVPAIRSIGCLARMFPARDTTIIKHLIDQLRSRNEDVSCEAATALGKFICESNFNHAAHSRTIIESGGVLPLMRLLRPGEKGQLQALFVICNLAINVGDSEALQQARVLTALELAGKSVVGQHQLLRELIPEAIVSLQLYPSDAHPPKQP